MRLLSLVLGFAAILVTLLTAVFMLGLGLLAVSAGAAAHVDLLPVEPESAPAVMIVGGLIGIAAAILALRKGRLERTLLILWCLAVTLALLRAGFGAGYRFDGEDHFRMGVWVWGYP